MKVHEDIYRAYIPILAVLPYNTMIYYPKKKSNYFHHCWETWHHLTSSQLPSGVVCWIDTQMTWIPHAHPKPK